MDKANTTAMCTLYSNTKGRELVRALFRVSDNRAAAYEPRDGILPSETAPVVRLADDGERELVTSREASCGLSRDAPHAPLPRARDQLLGTSGLKARHVALVRALNRRG